MCFLCVDLDYCVFLLDSNLISAVYFFITLFTQPFICTLFLLCVRFLEDIERRDPSVLKSKGHSRLAPSDISDEEEEEE